ncbi:MAG: nucleoside phosphorylase [Bacteroidales bacterium]
MEASELIINNDGSIFHLKLFPFEVAENIILVGDPGRVALIGEYFDRIEVKKQNREFSTITGIYKNKRITVTSSGIGTDNIDIVLNELDALKNIDLEKRRVKDLVRPIHFIRIGTSGSLQEDIPSGAMVVTRKAIGLDNLPHFYKLDRNEENRKIEHNLKQHFNWNQNLSYPYVTDASEKLLKKFQDKVFFQGMTISAPGFYGPQGRKLRLPLFDDTLNNKIRNFRFKNLCITNYEMESSAIYALSGALGHEAITICAIIANRSRKDHIGDYTAIMQDLTETVLENI